MRNVSFFEETILAYYQSAGRKNLPWRRNEVTPYHVWVSEILLQQTQVSRVVPYYQRFIAQFPCVEKLAPVSWEEFLTYYRGLGYYRRGRNMQKTALLIVHDYGGIFPRDLKLLQKLPGIGKYTAAAILAFGYGENVLAIDTNLQKVFGRFFYGTKNATVDFSFLAHNLRSEKKVLNAAIMDFANDICTNRPKCDICPLNTKCRLRKTFGKMEKQVQRTKSDFPTRNAQVFLWLHKDHTEYYSENLDEFEVFVLPPSVNTRETIKQHFCEHYGLELAVRPPHKKIYQNGIPTLFINAQILSGEHHLGIFKKEDVTL